MRHPRTVDHVADPLFGSFIDHVVVHELRVLSLCEHLDKRFDSELLQLTRVQHRNLGDGCREGGLAVVDVADRAHVEMWLRALECGHCSRMRHRAQHATGNLRGSHVSAPNGGHCA